MGLFKAIAAIAAAPLNIAKEISDDFTGENGDAAGVIGMSSSGISSAAKGLIKTLEKAAEEAEK